ncbi:serine hydrolase [Hutsoniella sourekii]
MRRSLYLPFLAVSLMILTACGKEPMIQFSQENDPANRAPVPQQEQALAQKEAEATQYSQDYDEFNNVDHLVQSVITQYNYPLDQISLAYYNYQTQEVYLLNEKQAFPAGSILNIGLARLYSDLVNQGLANWQDQIKYDANFHQAGEGTITNGAKKESYSIYELIYHALTEADPTASNLLVNHYQTNFGDLSQALVNLSSLQYPQPYQDKQMDAAMILNILSPIAFEENYDYIRTCLSEVHLPETFPTYHDTQLLPQINPDTENYHFVTLANKSGQPLYSLVILSRGGKDIGPLVSSLNLKLNEWSCYSMDHPEKLLPAANQVETETHALEANTQ